MKRLLNIYFYQAFYKLNENNFKFHEINGTLQTISSMITYLKFHSNLPGNNELNQTKDILYSESYVSQALC